MTRVGLGHTSRRTPTDHDLHIPTGEVADALAEYEAHLLAPTAD
jgi:hypothetical protein